MRSVLDDDGLAKTGPSPLLAALRRQWWLILICAVAVPFVAVDLSLLRPKQYTSTAGLLFQTSNVVQSVLGAPASGASLDPARDAATHVEQLSSPDVSTRTARALGGAISAADVAARVAVASAGESDIVTVSATDRSPAFAAQLAATYADQFIAMQGETVRAQADDALRAIQRELDALPEAQRRGRLGSLLRSRARQLPVVAAASPSGVTLARHPSVPTVPSSPQLKRNAALGLVLGLLLGIAAALLREQLDSRVRRAEDVGDAVDLPVLASVPRSRALARPLATSLPAYESEAFRMLDVKLRFSDDWRTTIRSLLLTSAEPGEGKTTVALHLGDAWARAGYDVLLMEADLRKPSLATILGLPPSQGLGDFLGGRYNRISDLWRPASFGGGSKGSPATTGLYCIPAGEPSSDPLELLGSERMRLALQEAQRRFSAVIVDAPPAGVVADALPLMNMVSGVIIVTRLGHADRERLKQFRQQLEDMQAPMVGVVINSTEPDGRPSFLRYAIGAR
jgi:capsular exopolysaccharide synthesis family protein